MISKYIALTGLKNSSPRFYKDFVPTGLSDFFRIPQLLFVLARAGTVWNVRLISMKLRDLLLVALVFPTILVAAEKRQHSNANSPRSMTRNIVPPNPEAAPALAPSPAPATPPAANSAATQFKPAPIPEKTAAEKAAIVHKTVDSQRVRAEAGSAIAQYDYGMRFLNGNGVDKNEETARKWLELSAKQGNSQAEKKLAELGAVKK